MSSKKTDINTPETITTPTFVEKIREKKKTKVKQKLERIEQEDFLDTIVDWMFNNWIVTIIIFCVIGYYGYNAFNDYLEERRIRIEAEAQVEAVKERTKQIEIEVTKWREKWEQEKEENLKLRSQISKLSPSQKKEIISEQISRLKSKMDLVEEKKLLDRITEGMLEVTSPE